MGPKSLKSLIEEAMEGDIESYNNALSRIEKLIIKFYGEISVDKLEDLKFDWFVFIVENRKYVSNLTYLYREMELDAKVYNLEIPVPVDELSKALVREYDIDYHMDRPMVLELVDVCTPREKKYIIMRYFSSPCLTLDEIGKLEGLTGARIGVIINKGLRKIRYWNRKLLRGLCYRDMEDKSCKYDIMQWKIDMSEYSMRHQIPMIVSIQIPEEEEIQEIEEEPIDTKEVAKEEPKAQIEEEISQETKPNTKCNESYYDDFYRSKKEFIEKLSNIEEDEDCYKEDECAIDYNELESKVKEYSKVKLKITNIDDVIVGFWNSKIEI